MYIVSMMDLDVFDVFEKHVYNIFKGNCVYNKLESPDKKGEDFFKKSKCKYIFVKVDFTDTSAKN